MTFVFVKLEEMPMIPGTGTSSRLARPGSKMFYILITDLAAMSVAKRTACSFPQNWSYTDILHEEKKHVRQPKISFSDPDPHMACLLDPDPHGGCDSGSKR